MFHGAFIAGEIEELTGSVGYAAAHGAAKLIALENGNGGREEIARVELFVADELKQIAVQGLCTGLGDQSYDAARGEAGIGSVVGACDAEFLDGIDSREGQGFAGSGVVVVKTVVEEVVLDILGAHDVHAAAARSKVGTLRHIGNAGNGETEGAEVAAVERQVDNLLFHYDLANRTVGSVDQGYVGFDGDGFVDTGDLHLEVDAADLVDKERDAGFLRPGETGSFDGDFVRARGQQRRVVVTAVVGGGGTGLAVTGVVNHHVGSRNGGAGGTGDGTDKTTRSALRHGGSGEREGGKEAG